MASPCTAANIHLTIATDNNRCSRQQFFQFFSSTNKFVATRTHRHPRLAAPPVRASLNEDDGSTNDEIELERQKLMKSLSSQTLSGSELRQLVFDKFNREYDCRLQRRGDRMYFQIFWKFLGQRSFPLTEEEYQLQLDAVAEYLTMWGVADIVREGIKTAKYAPGHTIGGGARAFSIPLGVDVGQNGRSNEWNSF